MFLIPLGPMKIRFIFFSLIFFIPFLSSYAVYGMSGGALLTNNDTALRSVVGLYAYDSKTNESTHCTGTIISRRTIITAAHCLVLNSVPATEVIIGFGLFPFRALFDGSAVDNPDSYRRTTQFVIHPDYNKKLSEAQQIGSDVALIFLPENSSFPSFAKPLDLIYPYTLPVQPDSFLVYGVGRPHAFDSKVHTGDLVFRRGHFSTIKSASEIVADLNLLRIDAVDGNIFENFGVAHSPFILAKGVGAQTHGGDSGSGLIQNYYGTLRVVGVLKGDLSLNEKNYATIFANLHEPKMNQWIRRLLR